jgi:hypothetical protein
VAVIARTVPVVCEEHGACCYERRGQQVAQFTEVQPTLENYWRAVILFGRNVASYKFALGHSLLELASQGKEVITLEELSDPFSRHICDHLKIADKQGTSKSSQFLDVCRKFNAGEVKKEEQPGALDAFHVHVELLLVPVAGVDHFHHFDWDFFISSRPLNSPLRKYSPIS